MEAERLGRCPTCGNNGTFTIKTHFQCGHCDDTEGANKMDYKNDRSDTRKIIRALVDIKQQLQVMNRLKAMDFLSTLTPEEQEQYRKDLGLLKEEE